MANGTNIFDFDNDTLAEFLVKVATGGTYDDVFTTLKTDLVAATAVQIPENGGQLWSNGMDDYLQATYAFFYKKTATWGLDTQAALQALGSDDGIAVNDQGWAKTTQTQYYCASIDSPTTSTWTAVPAGGLSRQAAYNGGGSVTTAGPAYSTTGPASIEFSSSSAGVAITADTALELTSDSAGVDVVAATDITIAAAANVAVTATTGAIDITASAGDTTVKGVNAILEGLTQGATNPGGDAIVKSGPGGSTSGDSGDVELTVGALTSGTIGVVHITNTCLQIQETATVPGGAVTAGKGKYWVKNTVPSKPFFTGDDDVDIDLSGGGGSSFAYVDKGNVSGAVTIDWTAGNYQRMRLTGNVTLTYTDPDDGDTSLVLEIEQDGTGGRSVTWDGGVTTPNGVVQQPATALNSITTFRHMHNSGVYRVEDPQGGGLGFLT